MKKPLIISLLCLLLAGCGFHLKGTLPTEKNLPKNIQLVLATPDQKLHAIIEKTFRQQDITLSAEAEYKIHLTDIENKKRSVILAKQQKGSIKEVILMDGFQAKIFHRDQLLGDRQLSSQMVIRYRSSAYLGSSREEDNAHQHLGMENAEKLLRFFQAVTKL